MRRSDILLAMAIPLMLSCAHYPSPPATETPTGSVTTLPAYVFDPASAHRRDGATYRTFRGCAATYVAPHLLLTSSSAFPKIGDAGHRADAPIAIQAPDGSTLHVQGVVYMGVGDGIALVRTWEKGQALPLSPLATPSGPLTAVGFRYGPMPDDHSLPTTQSYQAIVAPEPEPYNSGGTFIRFRVTPLLDDAACGTPLIDREGNLAGIIYEKHGAWLSAISAPAIAEAIHRAH